MRNDTDKPMHDPDFPDDPLASGFTRIYEMFNWYEDVPNAKIDTEKNDPLYKSLAEEIRKEIDAEIVRTICFNATK